MLTVTKLKGNKGAKPYSLPLKLKCVPLVVLKSM